MICVDWKVTWDRCRWRRRGTWFASSRCMAKRKSIDLQPRRVGDNFAREKQHLTSHTIVSPGFDVIFAPCWFMTQRKEIALRYLFMKFICSLNYSISIWTFLFTEKQVTEPSEWVHSITDLVERVIMISYTLQNDLPKMSCDDVVRTARHMKWNCTPLLCTVVTCVCD